MCVVVTFSKVLSFTLMFAHGLKTIVVTVAVVAVHRLHEI